MNARSRKETTLQTQLYERQLIANFWMRYPWRYCVLHGRQFHTAFGSRRLSKPPYCAAALPAEPGRRVFSVAGPTTSWNYLPDRLRDPAMSFHSFRILLKTNYLPVIKYMGRRGNASWFCVTQKTL